MPDTGLALGARESAQSLVLKYTIINGQFHFKKKKKAGQGHIQLSILAQVVTSGL